MKEEEQVLKIRLPRVIKFHLPKTWDSRLHAHGTFGANAGC